MDQDLSTSNSTQFKFQIDGGASLGQFITTGTQILLQLSFCDNKEEQLSIIDDVLRILKIEPEDLNRMRRNDKRAGLSDEGDEEYSFNKTT